MKYHINLGVAQQEVLKYCFINGENLIQPIQKEIGKEYKTVYTAVKSLEKLGLIEKRGKKKTSKERSYATYGLTERGFALGVFSLNLNNSEVPKGINNWGKINPKILEVWGLVAKSVGQEKAIDYFKGIAKAYNYIDIKGKDSFDTAILISILEGGYKTFSNEERNQFYEAVFEKFKENEFVMALSGVYRASKGPNKRNNNQKKSEDFTSKKRVEE